MNLCSKITILPKDIFNKAFFSATEVNTTTTGAEITVFYQNTFEAFCCCAWNGCKSKTRSFTEAHLKEHVVLTTRVFVSLNPRWSEWTSDPQHHSHNWSRSHLLDIVAEDWPNGRTPLPYQKPWMRKTKEKKKTQARQRCINNNTSAWSVLKMNDNNGWGGDGARPVSAPVPDTTQPAGLPTRFTSIKRRRTPLVYLHASIRVRRGFILGARSFNGAAVSG